MTILSEVSVQPAAHPNNAPHFDYNDVSSSVGKFLRGQADRIRRSVVKSIIDVGKDLKAAKHYLSHGAFLRWVEKEVGIPRRTAQAYMQVAQWVSDKHATVAHLPPTLLYLLSAPSTPNEFIVDVLERAEAGEHIALPAIRRELKVLRESKRDRNHNDACLGPRLVPCDRKAEMNDQKLGGQATVMTAVAILAHGLSRWDFARVRDIMTSRSILDDPKLAQTIETAFLTVGDTRKLNSRTSASDRLSKGGKIGESQPSRPVL